jgi:hypothetical protein
MKFSTSLYIAFLFILLMVLSGAGQCFAKTASFQCQNCTVVNSSIDSTLHHPGDSAHPQQTEKHPLPDCNHATLCHSDIAQPASFVPPSSPSVLGLTLSSNNHNHSVYLNNFISSNFTRPPQPTISYIPIFTLHCSFLI